MKKNIFFLIACAIIVASCGSKSGGAGGGGPIPPPSVAAKINSAVIVAPTSGTLVINGSGTEITKAVINLSVVGNPVPTLSADGISFSGTQYTTPDLYESKTIVFGASNSAGSDSRSVYVTVNIDPTFAKLCGTSLSQGQSWRPTSHTKQLVTGGPIIPINIDCDLDDKLTFYANRTLKGEFGNDPNCPTGTTVRPNDFTFNSGAMTLQLEPAAVQPLRTVVFSGNTMECSYTKSGYILREYYLKL